MKKFRTLFLIGLLFVLATGCTPQKDTLKFLQGSASPFHMQSFSYEIKLGHQVNGAAVDAELWQNGVCTKSAPILLPKETKKLACSLLIDRSEADGAAKGVSVQLDTDEAVGSALTFFELPQKVLGYSFTAYEDRKIIDLHAGEEVLLCAVAFDTGTGVRSVSCERLSEDSEQLQEYACLLVIRASFTAEPLHAQEEAEAMGK